MKNFNFNIKAFTLLETLASVAILALVVVGPLSVISSSSAFARQTKDVITATYLAEQAIELLQNQYDSIYLYCKKNPTATDPGNFCDPSGTPELTTGQTAWRVFKQRLGATVSPVWPSCYIADNPFGCSFDASSTSVVDITVIPPRYQSDNVVCKYLVNTAITVPVAPGTIYSYRCLGINPTTYGGVFQSKKYFYRVVSIEQLATFELGTRYQQYNDDLRVTAEVTFTGVNGLTQSLKVIRFMHARS